MERKKAILLSAFFCLLAVLSVWVWLAVKSSSNYRPDSTRESGFLRSYSAQQVVDRFAVASFNSSLASDETSSGGRNSVENEREVSPTFVACGQARASITAALQQDVVQKLHQSGAKVVQVDGDPVNGFQVVYGLPRVLGRVRVAPVSFSNEVHRNEPLPGGMADLNARVRIEETWYATETAARKETQLWR